MPRIDANGITLEYETEGLPTDPPLLMISGLGGQLINWDHRFVDALADRGFFVVRFDNRDVGLSTWFDESGPTDVHGATSGRAQPAYLLADMAEDAAALLGGLGLPSAHVLGVSMGGMIAQSLAIAHADRVDSLVSIMSTTGDRSVGQAQPAAAALLVRPPARDRDEVMDQAIESRKIFGSPGFPLHEDQVRAQASAAFDRAFHPEGTARQLAAIVASPDRTAELSRLDCPTLVIHGEADTLIDPSGGRATAAAVPGAELWVVPGMGHHLPPELFDELADRIATHAHAHDGRTRP